MVVAAGNTTRAGWISPTDDRITPSRYATGKAYHIVIGQKNVGQKISLDKIFVTSKIVHFCPIFFCVQWDIAKRIGDKV